MLSLEGMSLADVPAMPPPPGIISNFDDPETTASALLVINWVFTPLAALMVCIRIYTTALIQREQHYGWDDALITLAMLGSIVHAVLVTLAIPYGYGRHMWDIRAISLTKSRLELLTSFEPTYFITVLLIKLSILLLYRRFFGIYGSSRLLINVGFIVVTLITIPAFGVAVARSKQCNGIQALTIELCHSRNVSIGLITFSTCNTLTDFYTLIIPISRVLKLHISRKKKIGLLAIFLGGLAACIMSVVRLVMVIINFNDSDPLWNGSKITPFTVVEMNLGIICNCMVFMPAASKKAQATAASLLGTTSDSARSIFNRKTERTETLQSNIDSKNDIALMERDMPDLPPFLGGTSPSLISANSNEESTLPVVDDGGYTHRLGINGPN